MLKITYFLHKYWVNAADLYTFPTFRVFRAILTNLAVHYLGKGILTSQ